MSGPLAGVRVVELAGIGPIQLGCMLLADLGAEVARVERPGGHVYTPPGREVVHRSRPSLVVDLRTEAGTETVLRMVERADVLVEAYRPGVAERLGLGPDACARRNPALVYARMTGWGQSGPLAQRAGHDINYLALTGALAGIGPPREAPVPPLNLVADFGGGAMFLVVGVLSALPERGSARPTSATTTGSPTAPPCPWQGKPTAAVRSISSMRRLTASSSCSALSSISSGTTSAALSTGPISSPARTRRHPSTSRAVS